MPLWVMLQVIGDAFGNQNVPRIAAIHHPLRDVNPSAGNVGLLVEVGYLVDRSAVNSHANVKFGMIFQRFADLERAQNGRFETVSKNERAAIAGGQAY